MKKPRESLKNLKIPPTSNSHILLGPLALINLFASLISSSVFFGLRHKFSHPERKADFLLLNVLAGFVLSWVYLYTKKPSACDCYGISTSIILRTTVNDMISYLSAIYSPKALLLGISIRFALLGITYLLIKLRKRKKS